MLPITGLTGTDTFETLFNTTNTVISSLNNQNPRLVSVRDYGAVGNGTTDDTLGISAALNAVNGITTSVLYFPRGDYLLTGTGPRLNRQIERIMNRPLHIIGEDARIVCGTTAQHMWFISNAGYDVKIQGIKFDGNNKALACLAIDDSLGMTATIEIDRCAFLNSYQGGDLGTGFGGGGLFISGSKYVNLTNSQVINHTRANGTGTQNSAGTVGVAIQRSGNAYPKTVNVSGCYFENVSSGWTQSNSNSDCDCLSVFGYLASGITGITFNESAATITNNHFRNCKGRSIKIQNDRSIISNNTFYRNILPIAQPAEVNAQFVVGQIYNNNFYYEPTSTGLTPFAQSGLSADLGGFACINFYNGDKIRRTRSYTVSGNQVINSVPKSAGTLINFFGTSHGYTGAANPLFFTATNNKIIGPIMFFGNVGTHDHRSPTLDTAPTFYQFTGNMVEQLTDAPGKTFGWLYSSTAFSATMNNFSLIDNVNTGVTTAGILYSSTILTGAEPLSSHAHNPSANKINNYRID